MVTKSHFVISLGVYIVCFSPNTDTSIGSTNKIEQYEIHVMIGNKITKNNINIIELNMIAAGHATKIRCPNDGIWQVESKIICTNNVISNMVIIPARG